MMTILIILAVLLAALTIGQMMRVFEASSKLKGGTPALPSEAENKYQGRSMFLFMLGYFAFFIWCMFEYGPYLLPVSASEHGVVLDNLLNFNFAVITLVFVITHVFLFYFAMKYAYSKERKAFYYTHSNKLELLWTTVPAIFLAVIIVYGLSAWIDITDDAPEGSLTIELYPKQFDWTARYSGADEMLGASNYNMISGTNPLGLITNGSLDQMIGELETDIAGIKEEIENSPKDGLKESELTETLGKRERQLERVKGFKTLEAANRATGDDDVLVKTEFYIPVGREVDFKFRSRDVIHSAYFPHFRAQMNCVPGMTTQFHFKPTITSAEMKQKVGDDEFEYYLLCNKICGAAHYNMKMVIKVVEEEEYNAWIAEQKTFSETIAPADVAESNSTELSGNAISMIEE